MHIYTHIYVNLYICVYINMSTLHEDTVLEETLQYMWFGHQCCKTEAEREAGR